MELLKLLSLLTGGDLPLHRIQVLQGTKWRSRLEKEHPHEAVYSVQFARFKHGHKQRSKQNCRHIYSVKTPKSSFKSESKPHTPPASVTEEIWLRMSRSRSCKQQTTALHAQNAPGANHTDLPETKMGRQNERHTA